MTEIVRPASDWSEAGEQGEAPAQAPTEKRKGAFPAPVTILTAVLILVWIAAFFIPSGEYTHDPSGSPVAGSFRNVDPPLDFKGRVEDLMLAPVNGMYGIQDASSWEDNPLTIDIMSEDKAKQEKAIAEVEKLLEEQGKIEMNAS